MDGQHKGKLYTIRTFSSRKLRVDFRKKLRKVNVNKDVTLVTIVLQHHNIHFKKRQETTGLFF